MRRTKKLLSLLVATVLLVSAMSTVAFAAGSAENVIIDGGFDAWNGWAGEKGMPAVTAEVGMDHAASDYLGRWVANPGLLIPAGAGVWQWNSTYTTDTDYVLTVMAKALDTDSTGTVLVDGNFTAGGDKKADVSGTEWKEYRIEFKSRSSVKSGQIKLMAGAAGEGVVFDDVKLVVKGTETSIIIDGGFDAWNGWAGEKGMPAVTAEVGMDHAASDYLGRWVANPGLLIPAGAGVWQWNSTYTTDTDYVLTVMAKALDADSTGTVLVDGNFAAGGDKKADVSGTEWKEYKIEFRSRSSVKNGQIKLMAGAAGEGVVFDDAKLIAVGATATEATEAATEAATDTAITSTNTTTTEKNPKTGDSSLLGFVAITIICSAGFMVFKRSIKTEKA